MSGLPLTRTAQNRIGHYRTREQTTLMECLTRNAGLSPAEAKHLIFFGAVYDERRRVSADRALLPGRYVRVHFVPKRFPVEGIDWKSTIAHCDDEFVVVDKPAGIPVHPTVDNRLENVAHQVGAALGFPVYVTQRLDNEVAGLMVLARTRNFQREFNRLLVERKVRKRYRALVTSPPELGRYIHYMEPTKRSPKTVVAEPRQDWLFCALSVVGVAPLGHLVDGVRAYRVEINLETGRTHQIRAQLSALGSPIVGDSLYGSTTRHEVNGSGMAGIALVSQWIAWPDIGGGQHRSFAIAPGQAHVSKSGFGSLADQLR